MISEISMGEDLCGTHAFSRVLGTPGASGEGEWSAVRAGILLVRVRVSDIVQPSLYYQRKAWDLGTHKYKARWCTCRMRCSGPLGRVGREGGG